MRLRHPAIFPGLLIMFSVQSIGFLAGQPGNERWNFLTGGTIQSSPAIGPEGVIYVGSQDSKLYAIQPDGTEKWTFEASQAILQDVAIGDNGVIYAVDNTGKLWAVNPDGTERWTFTPTSGSPPSEMAVSADGTIYYGVAQTYYAVNPDGTQFWAVTNTLGLTAGMSIGNEGVVIAAHGNGPVVALDPLTGAQLWRFNSDFGGSQIAPGFAEDGTLYFGVQAQGNNFYAVNPDGTLKWKVALDAQIDAGPSTAVNGDIYVPINFNVNQGMQRGFVVSLDPEDGSENWRYESNGGVGTVPAVGLDGNIYFSTTSNRLIALRPDGTELWVFEPQTGGGGLRFNSSPSIAQDGTVYFGSTDRRLYAIEGSSSGPAASSWPKKLRDVRNTGQSGSSVTRRQWFAPQVYWLDDANNAVVTIAHVGERVESPASAASFVGGAGIGSTTAAFSIDVVNRDGMVFFSIEDTIEPGETKDYVMAAPDSSQYSAAVIVDSSVKDGRFLAPFLTWNLDVSDQLEPLRIGAFFSEAREAALAHHFPAEASASNGLGIGVQNVGKNSISCDLNLFNSDGTDAAQQTIVLGPDGSVVQFFNELVLPGGMGPGGETEFRGRGAFSCDAPVVAVAVNQDFSNGSFPTDRVTIKGVN